MRFARWALVVAAVLFLGAAPARASDYSVAGIDDPALVTACVAALRQAVSRDDRPAVAVLIAYPIRVTVRGRKRAITTRAAFLARYDAIITPAVRAALLKEDKGPLFANWQGVMLGNGEVWFGLVGKTVRVIAINN